MFDLNAIKQFDLIARRMILSGISIYFKTRTTIVVRNAGCAPSRYTLKLSHFFNQSINQQSIPRTAHPPLKI